MQEARVKSQSFNKRIFICFFVAAAILFGLFSYLIAKAGVIEWVDNKFSVISAGNLHTCAITSGETYCWGLNTNGQLGNNSTTQSLVPVAVDATGVLAGKTVTAISAGGSHTCAVASGAAYCWGLNTSGRLGNNSTAQSLVPVAVDATGVLSGKTVTAISAGGTHTCAVGSSAAYCWGFNGNGHLGNNSTAQSLVPVAVDTTGVLSGKTVTDIAAGETYTCTVGSSAAYCWGSSTNGQLGNSSTSQSLVPVAVNTAGVLSGKTITAISAGSFHACAIGGGGYCWGNASNGQLGHNTAAQSTVPVAARVSIFFSHSPYRFFGDSNTIQPGAPLAGIDVPSVLPSQGSTFRMRMGVFNEVVIGSVSAVAGGGTHTCAIADATAYCAGLNTNGQLGNNSILSSFVLTNVDTTGVLSGKSITAISAGTSHTCAVASGAAYCWGLNTNGQLGNNSTTQSLVPVAVNTAGVLSGKTITAISAGTNHTCAVASGAAYCWGLNTSGRLGNNSTTQSLVPVAVDATGVLAGKTVTAISAGTNHTCAVASGAAYCWGLNTNGQLGNNSTTQSLVPVAVNTAGVLSGKTITAISAGGTHTCVVGSSTAYCWGAGSTGQLGNNSTAQSNVPVAVTATGVLSGKAITAISAASNHSCVVGSSAAYCWGFNSNGRLGNNSTAQSNVPVAVTATGVLSGKTVTAISALSAHSCAVGSGAAYCWGANGSSSGRLANNATADSTVPVAVITVLSAQVPAETANLKLQLAQKSTVSCSQQATGFTDVSATSPIAWYSNPSITNGASISVNANDPTASANTVHQTYVSGGASFTNTITAQERKYSLWDFSLKDNSGLTNTSYCFKITYADGRNLEARQTYPEITTAAPSFSLGFVDSAGATVSNPAFAMSTTNLLSTCQTVSGQMGSLAGSRMRISQGSPGNGWNVSLAAKDGVTSTWTRVAAGAFYDYNDASGSPAGCNSGSDGDGLAGQLSVAPNTISITPQSGCGTTGLSLGGGMTGFAQGSVDAITLLTATSASSPNCYWDLPGMNLQQRIPASQPQGSYEIQLTATVVAQ